MVKTRSRYLTWAWFGPADRDTPDRQTESPYLIRATAVACLPVQLWRVKVNRLIVLGEMYARFGASTIFIKTIKQLTVRGTGIRNQKAVCLRAPQTNI